MSATSPTVAARADRLLAGLTGTPARAARVTHVEHVPPRAARWAAWPAWADPEVLAALAARGVREPYTHQVAAAEHAHAGRSVVVSTGTASGKSVAYLLPALTAVREGATSSDGRGATVLYLSPTKALAADQLRALTDLGVPGVRPATVDGDTPTEERDWARAHASYVLTNPDMLHHSLLPGHARWAPFWRALRYVVVDECHAYRGVFGSHVAAVLRRLRRVAQRYGSDPVFVLASATVSEPDVSAGRLVGRPVVAVTQDGSPRGATSFVLWEPPLTTLVGERGAPVRRSVHAETADLLADLVVEGARTLAFIRSRRGAEIVSLMTKDLVGEVDGSLPDRVAAYRAGYLPEERRAVEADLQSGRLLGVAATSALELGVDVAGLDAVLLAGWPGTLSSMWQQAGRAGRAGQGALAVLVARDDPLDTYLVHHPEAVFGRPVEATVLDPTNPYVLAPHLCAAAAEARWHPGTSRGSDRAPAPSSTTWSSGSCCGRDPAAGTGPGRNGHRTSPTSVAPGAVPCGWSRPRPGGWSARSTVVPRTGRFTRVRSTCTRPRPTSSTAWTWAKALPSSRRRHRTGRPPRGR